MNPIVLITDFGTSSPYVAEMKGAILTVNAKALIIDGTHTVPAQDVVNGAFVVKQLVSAFPEKTVFIVVVDPGVGSVRNILLVEYQRRLLIAPDNGVLSLLVESDAQFHILDKPSYWSDTISSTFHGRDMMGPVAAHLTNGVSLSEISTPTFAAPVQIEWPSPEVRASEVVGEIVYVDSFGNLITNIASEQVLQSPNGVVEFCQTEIPLVATYANQDPGSAIALTGSGGWLEIAVTNGDARRHFAARVGDPVRYRWQ